MREIKFRGKRVDNDEWVFGMLDTIYQSDRFTTISYLDKENYYCEDKVIPETVGQCIGRLEYYEGDILSTQERDIFFVIVWDSFNCSFKFRNIKTNSYYEIDESLTRLELVGNIHDNPELLK